MFFCLAASATGQDVADSNKADRDQLTAIVDKWEKAWNSHDMNAFANLFHEDGIRILWTGDVWKGGRAIEQGHAAVHKTVFRNSVQRERIEELTFVGSDAAVIRFFSTLTGDERDSRQDDPQPQDRNRDEASGDVEGWMGTEHEGSLTRRPKTTDELAGGSRELLAYPPWFWRHFGDGVPTAVEGNRSTPLGREQSPFT